MSLNDTPSAERVHIGFFGRRNAGKSSLVNAVCGQDLAIVSSTKGTTTDPVLKSMELLPLGPVVIIDTPGFDDEGALGDQRVRKARRALDQTDIAVLVVDAQLGMGACERQLLDLFDEKKVPHLIAYNKCDLLEGKLDGTSDPRERSKQTSFWVSARTGDRIKELKEGIAALGTAHVGQEPRLLADLLAPGDIVLFVIPIDKAAPKGRLILPEQMGIRDALDAGAISLTSTEKRLPDALGLMEAAGQRPDLIVCDSQAFGEVAQIVPRELPLTSFSILMARYKGLLADALQGVAAIDRLRDGDRVLVSEGCTHHRQCGDIGTVKIPRWLQEHTGAKLSITASSGRAFPDVVSDYDLVIHCGGCMLNGREMQHRAAVCAAQGVPMTNYGLAIAYMKGILRRSLSPFPELAALLDEKAASSAATEAEQERMTRL